MRFITLTLAVVSLVSLLALAVVPAQAQVLVTTSAAIPTPQKVIDFSQFTSSNFTLGPMQIGGLVGENVIWQSSNPNALIAGNIFYGLGTNGSWDSGRGGFTALNATNGTMTYTFNSGPVNAVGGFLNYIPGIGGDVIISALDASNSVIASYDITLLAPISTPSTTNAGGFRGIVSTSANIAAFRVANSYVVLDNLTFSRTSAVPEPGSIALLATSTLTGAGFLARRRRRARKGA